MAKPAQVEESKKAMSKMRQILGHPDRIKILAEDIISHYENLISEKPKIVQKAMIAQPQWAATNPQKRARNHG